MNEIVLNCDTIAEDRMTVALDGTRLHLEIEDVEEDYVASIVLTDEDKVKELAQILVQCLRYHQSGQVPVQPEPIW